MGNSTPCTTGSEEDNDNPSLESADPLGHRALMTLSFWCFKSRLSQTYRELGWGSEAMELITHVHDVLERGSQDE